MNSFIRSKNKVNRTVESQAIKNINIDKKIEEYKKWQSLIKKELDLIKSILKIKIKVKEIGDTIK